MHRWTRALVSLSITLAVPAAALAGDLSKPEIVDIIHRPDGSTIHRITVPGGLPPAVKMPIASVPMSNMATGVNVLGDVPAFDWSHGCSATSAAMLAGYYDRTGYPNMYAGPANGGVCPLDNSIWGYGTCPLSATEQGVDSLPVRGHVDDYWVSYNHAGPDPFVTGGWQEHTWADCTGDYMKTNQAAFGNVDGATTFYYYGGGTPFASSAYPADGGYGLELFLESRGYTVTARYNQYIAGYSGTSGFSFQEFQQEIDAGRPVLIHVAGHTMLGYGYNTSGSKIYIHDTWDHHDHEMVWGGSYSGMTHYGVTVIRLAPNDYVFVDDFETGDCDFWSTMAP